jgi:uncharacterized protein YciI
MKSFSLFLFLLPQLFISQLKFPEFLQGTWQVENKEQFEHWDILNQTHLKGYSYHKTNSEFIVEEYIEIKKINTKIIYTAHVINQNNGKGVDFKLTQADSSYVFENKQHYFPKKLIYKKINADKIYVTVGDNKNNRVSYFMNKISNTSRLNDTSIKNKNYNAQLANTLGADNYGMKNYILVLLKTGENINPNEDLKNKSYEGHFKNIDKLINDKKLIIVGPINKNENNYRGLFILDVDDFTSAEQLISNDAAIKNGYLSYELYNWYGSAALPKNLEISDKIWKIKP